MTRFHHRCSPIRTIKLHNQSRESQAPTPTIHQTIPTTTGMTVVGGMVSGQMPHGGRIRRFSSGNFQSNHHTTPT